MIVLQRKGIMKNKNHFSVHHFLMLPVFWSLSSLASGGSPVKSKVKEVCVFTTGARVMAEGEMLLQKGTQEIQIEGISAFADVNSLTFQCNSEFSLLSLRLMQGNKNASAPGTEAQATEDSIRMVSLKLNRIQNQQTALQEELAMLKANQKIAGTGGIQTSELEKAAGFFRNRIEDILNRQHDTELMKNKLQDRLNLLQEKLQNLSSEQNSGSMTAVVLLKVPQSGKATFQLSYTCGNAGWTPHYDIQAASNQDKITFIAKASVWQNTGINWNDVKLSLSTGSPSNGQGIPEISPWYLSINPTQPKAKMMHPGRAAAAIAPAMPSAKYEEVGNAMDFKASSIPESQVSEGVTQTIYELSNSYSLRSNRNAISVDIQKFELLARFQYLCRPRQDKSAFLEARLKDWGKSGLLPGEANLYLDGNYTGKTFFETNSAGDTLSLSFGKDQNISVERKQFKYQQDKNLTGTEKILEAGYDLQVKNRKSTASLMVVEDQIPVSTNTSAEVELLESSGASIDKETGILRWNLNLKGGESASLRFRFKVKFPKNMILDTRL